jgi:hypothetical protein
MLKDGNSDRNGLAIVILFLGAAALAVNGAIMLANRDGTNRGPTSPAVPHTVRLEEQASLPDGTMRRTLTYTYAVRGDGSSVELIERLFVPRHKQSSERTVSFANGVKVYLNDIRDLKSTVFIPTLDVAATQRDPHSKCVTSRKGVALGSGILLEEELIGTWRASKVAYSDTLMWFSLDFGCALVKQRVDLPGGGKSEQTATSLTSGEPAELLFSVPSHYREVPLSVTRGEAPGSSNAIAHDRFYNRFRQR